MITTLILISLIGLLDFAACVATGKISFTWNKLFRFAILPLYLKDVWKLYRHI